MLDIDDPELIEEVLTYHPQEIEPLYWIIEDSIDKRDVKLAKSVHKAFTCLAKYKKAILSDNLRPIQMKRLKEITLELYGGASYKERCPITIKEGSCVRPIPFEKESQLRDYLVSNLGLLSEAFGEAIKYAEAEVKTNFEYRCDILAHGENVCFPTEIKLRQANHSVVSQIEKYCHYFYKRFRYALYKDIQGVVIANGFDPYSINELRRNNIWCFEAIPHQDGIKLHKVED